MRFKKTLSLIITTFLILSNSNIFNVLCSAAINTANITIGSVSGKPGDEVDITFSIPADTGLASFAFDVNFNNNYLTPISYQSGLLLKGSFIVNLNYNTTTLRAAYASTEKITAAGTLFTVRFKISNSAPNGTEYPINMQVNKFKTVDSSLNTIDIPYNVVTGKIATTPVTPTTVSTTGVALNKAFLSLVTGNTYNLIANVIPENATNTNINWSSSNENVASVNQSGVVTAVSKGTATITATTQDGGYKQYCKVYVAQQYVNITAGNVSGKQGDEVDVAFNIPENSDVASFEFDVKYDSNFLTPIAFQKGQILNGTFAPNLIQYPSTVRVTYVGTSNVNKAGTLFTIRYKITSSTPGGTNTPITVQVNNFLTLNSSNEYQDIPYVTTSSAISVTEKPVATADALFEVSITDSQGKPILLSQIGEVVDVKLYLKLNGIVKDKRIALLQNEIKFDSRYFQYVEDSIDIPEGLNFSSHNVSDGINRVLIKYSALNNPVLLTDRQLLCSFKLKTTSLPPSNFAKALVYNNLSKMQLKDSTGSLITNTAAIDSEIYFITVYKDECFIATAAYGSKFQSDVSLLREFRDKVLLKNKLGKQFVEYYYATSPPIADYIRSNDALKIIVRILLTPLVAIAYVALQPILLCLLMALFLSGIRFIHLKKTKRKMI